MLKVGNEDVDSFTVVLSKSQKIALLFLFFTI